MVFPETFGFTKEENCKQQALKVLEEAAELVEAEKRGEDMLEEAMDVYQALSNYCEQHFDLETLQKGYDEVFIKNWRRGYYECNYGGTLYDEALIHAREMGIEE